MTLPARLDAEVYAAYLQAQRARPGLTLETYLAERAKPAAPAPVPAERTVKRVTGSRQNQVIVTRPDLSVKLNVTEERRYEWLIAQPEVVHVDLKPVFDLPGPIRYHADFLVHTSAQRQVETEWGLEWVDVFGAWVEDVKGSAKLDTAFRRVRALFDATHPLAPLRVIRWVRPAGAWEDA